MLRKYLLTLIPTKSTIHVSRYIDILYIHPMAYRESTNFRVKTRSWPSISTSPNVLLWIFLCSTESFIFLGTEIKGWKTTSTTLGCSKWSIETMKPNWKEKCQKASPKDPWDWYIYLHEWLIFMVNVGKYTSPMDPLGSSGIWFHPPFCSPCFFLEVSWQKLGLYLLHGECCPICKVARYDILCLFEWKKLLQILRRLWYVRSK